MIMCRQLVVLTGAGCSTESSVPDYRGPQGAYSTGFKPITHQQVLPTTASRQAPAVGTNSSSRAAPGAGLAGAQTIAA